MAASRRTQLGGLPPDRLALAARGLKGFSHQSAFILVERSVAPVHLREHFWPDRVRAAAAVRLALNPIATSTSGHRRKHSWARLGSVKTLRFASIPHGGTPVLTEKQRSAKVAQDILAKRKTEVAMRVHFPTRAFDTVTFAELADYWWQAHGSKTRSQFDYLYPRVLEYFTDKRAREITPDAVDAFLDHLATERKLSASSINHHRTIVNGIFNFAVKRGRFDKNPVAAVRQWQEPPGRDRIVSPAEFRMLWDKAEGDREMRAFLALAGTTTMRKGEVLSLRWDRVHFEDAPYATLVRTKTGHQRHVPIPQSIIKTLKALPSHCSHEYLFPSRPTARCPKPQRPYRWDLGKQFRALAKATGIQNVCIHDLRHAGATILMTLGVPDPIVRKVTGHRSRELERYQHLTPELRAQTVNLITTELFRGKRARKERESGTYRHSAR
jgi:integrase